MNMGLGDTGPANAKLDWSNKTAGSGPTVYYELGMTGGDALPTGEYRVEITHGGSGSPYKTELDASPASGSVPDEMTAGDAVYFVIEDVPVNAPKPRFDATKAVSSGIAADNVDEVQLIWESPNTDETQVIREFSP